MGLCCCGGCGPRPGGGAGDREKMPVNHEAFLLMANSQNEMEDWVKAIRRVIWAPFGGGIANSSHAHKLKHLPQGIFGQRLEDTVQYERKYGQRLAPLLVEQCVDFIRERGLTEEGLFRMPGQANLVKDLQDSFDCGEKPLFDSNTDVHTVASLLKLYLRELPEPVIPFAKYEDFLSCGQLLSKDEGEGTQELVKQVKNLPQANYNLLKYICKIEEASADLRKQVVRLEEELDQERKKYTMLEIKLRNSERAREDAEKRNHLLQKEMEEFFSTLGCLTGGSQSAKVPK